MTKVTNVVPLEAWSPEMDLRDHVTYVDVPRTKSIRHHYEKWRNKTFTERELHKQNARKTQPEAAGCSIKKRKANKNSFWKYTSYLFGVMPDWSREVEKYPLLDFIDYTLRGSGQVIFCNNSITGLFILGAVYLGDPWIGVCSTIGLLCATVTALFLNFSKGAIRAGLFGFNGVLVGAALGTFLGNGKWTGSTVAAISLMSMFSTVLTASIGNFNSMWKVPTFTLPFNLCAIVFMLGVYRFLHFEMIPSISGAIASPHSVITSTAVWKGELPLAVLRGVSQVWLINDEYSGILILVGMAFCSPISSGFAALGSFVGLVVGVGMGVDASEILIGLWGYNAVLGCVAMGGVFYILSVKVFALCIMCGILCTILLGTFKGLFATLGMPAFTFPFCLGTIVFILVQTAIPDIFPMPLPAITIPERHIRLQKVAEDAIMRLRYNLMKKDKRKYYVVVDFNSAKKFEDPPREPSSPNGANEE